MMWIIYILSALITSILGPFICAFIREDDVNAMPMRLEILYGVFISLVPVINCIISILCISLGIGMITIKLSESDYWTEPFFKKKK